MEIILIKNVFQLLTVLLKENIFPRIFQYYPTRSTKKNFVENNMAKSEA